MAQIQGACFGTLATVVKDSSHSAQLPKPSRSSSAAPWYGRCIVPRYDGRMENGKMAILRVPQMPFGARVLEGLRKPE